MLHIINSVKQQAAASYTLPNKAVCWFRKVPLYALYFSTHTANMAENPDPKQANSILEFHAVDIDGNDVALSKYEGYVTYIVNLASQ